MKKKVVVTIHKGFYGRKLKKFKFDIEINDKKIKEKKI